MLCEISQILFKDLSKVRFEKIITRLNCSPVFHLVPAASPACNVTLEIQKYKVSYICNISINVKIIEIRVFGCLASERWISLYSFQCLRP